MDDCSNCIATPSSGLCYYCYHHKNADSVEESNEGEYVPANTTKIMNLDKHSCNPSKNSTVLSFNHTYLCMCADFHIICACIEYIHKHYVALCNCNV